jgi:hypothetical protein
MMYQFKVVGNRLCVVNPDPERNWDYIWGFYRIVKEMK